MEIRTLTNLDAATFARLRHQALESDPQAYLVDAASESKKPLSRYSAELQFACLMVPFGYYGLFSDAPSNTTTSTQTNLIGYVQLGSTNLPKQRHLAFLYNLYLDPQYRGQGLAHQLVTHVKDQAQTHGVEILLATCLAHNHAAYQFYQKLGFKECGIRHNSVKWQDEYDDEIELIWHLN